MNKIRHLGIEAVFTLFRIDNIPGILQVFPQIFGYFYRSPTKLREENAFSRVCLFTVDKQTFGILLECFLFLKYLSKMPQSKSPFYKLIQNIQTDVAALFQSPDITE